MDNTYAISHCVITTVMPTTCHRSRHALNLDTIREMHLAFRRSSRRAMRQGDEDATCRLP